MNATCLATMETWQHILVLNVGRSSVNCRVFGIDAQTPRFKQELPIRPEVAEAPLDKVADVLAAAYPTRINAIGHRVARGGERFRKATLIDDDVVVAAIESISPMAPLREPSALCGIRMARTAGPMPRRSQYSIPRSIAARHRALPPMPYRWGGDQRSSAAEVLSAMAWLPFAAAWGTRPSASDPARQSVAAARSGSGAINCDGILTLASATRRRCGAPVHPASPTLMKRAQSEPIALEE